MAASTLWEYYTALGQPLPPIAERAKLYEAYGLGPASAYRGTAEQNTKLLRALQAGAAAGPTATSGTVSAPEPVEKQLAKEIVQSIFAPAPTVSEEERAALRKRAEELTAPYYEDLLAKYLQQLETKKQRAEEDIARRKAETERVKTEEIARRGLTFSGIRGQELARAQQPLDIAWARALEDITQAREAKKAETELLKREALETAYERLLGQKQTEKALGAQSQSESLQKLLKLYGIQV